MLRIRKLVLAIAAASALSSGVANALGLGELTLKSAQNQPLDAEIELLDVRDLTAAELAPSLASPEEFAKAGVPLPGYLEDLTFTPVINPNGRSVLRVTSSQPLSEPVIKFLVQIMWPQGRLLRDYNVPLDQPQAAGTSSAPAGITPASSGGSYTTRQRDTLWQIAARNAQGGSVQQTMLAIQALNPDAFIGNNINQLKTGQVLRLPDAQQIRSIPQGEAIQDVAEQYAAWREGRRLGPRARQLDATRRGAAEAAPARIAQGDNLRLVSPDDQPSDARAVSDKLAVAQESLDTTQRDNEELKSRMVDLQSQLDKLQRLIQLKNDQLARLEAQGAADSATPIGEDVGAVPTPAAAPSQTAAEAPPVAALPAEPAIDAQLSPAEPVISPAPAATDTAPQPDPVDPTLTPAEEQSTLDQLLGSPLLLGLLAGSAFLVLLLLLLVLARKRRAQQEAEKHLRMARALSEDEHSGPDPTFPAGSFDDLNISAPTVTLSPAVVAASAAAATAAEKPVAAPVTAPADPHAALLLEVDESVANGRLNHAASLLEPAVAAEPERSELRLKLMEIYARQGDQYAFAGEEARLPATGDNQVQVEDLKQRFPAMIALTAVAGVGAAALAAELDEQYVQDLLQEHDETPAAPAEADVLEAADSQFVEAPTLDDNPDAAFDLSLDDDLRLDDPLEPSLADASVLDENLQPPAQLAADPLEEEPESEVQAVADPVVADDADADFETLLAQAQTPVEPPVADDFADFDLDVGDSEVQEPIAEAPVDVAAELAAFDDLPEFETISELELPEDFDLSLSLDEETPADKHFASELDDVNAELDKLSQSMGTPSLEPHLGASDAGQEAAPLDDLDFDFFSGTDEVATKLDLARAYIDMGDHQGARDILDEVTKDGNDGQRQEAEDMLSRLV